MASGSGDDNKRRAQPGDSTQGRPRGTTPPSSRPGAGDDVDFGAFVSERVRSASQRLKGEGAAPSTPEAPQAMPEETAPEPTPIRRQRPSRYWRDSLKDSTGEDVEPRGESSQRFIGRPTRSPRSEDEAAAGDGGDGGAWWTSLMGPGDGDDGDRNRMLLIYGLIAVVVLALLIFGLTRIFGGDDGGEDVVPTPTPTVESREEQTPPPTQAPTTGQPTSAEPTETPEIRRGGDNQLAPPGGSDEGTPAGSTGELKSEVARACTGECLIRLIDADVTEILQKTGNRPSFVGGDVAWLVVTPEEADELAAESEIALVENSAQTYNLYVITAPEGTVDPAIGADYGEVLDAIGVHALVAFNTVPASVRALLDNGYEVNKLAPAPPTSIAKIASRSPVTDVNPDALMGAVDRDGLETTIDDLSSTGELDNSGVGTRYYTLPGNQIAADYLYQELESYGLEVWYEDFVTWDGILLVNVVAQAPGRDESEMYAVMSHFDSFNTTTPRQAPGADDNATGIAVNLETARVLAGYELQHPVRFVFVNAEEVGIIGAQEWARAANAKGLPVRGVLNVDSVGSSRQGQYIATNADGGSAWLQDVLTDVNDRYGLGQVFQHLQDEEIVADDTMVRDEGIDAVMIARELYGWTPFHHTADDTMANVSITSVENMTYLTLLSIVDLAG